MTAFLYQTVLQFKLDIRSKTLLITCYVVPLLFFALMGGIFTSIMQDMEQTLIQSMSIMGISMGALIGLPPSVAEVCGSDIKKVYQANGVPLYVGLISMFLSSFIHLMIMCAIIYGIAPVAFNAILPSDPWAYFLSLAVVVAVSLSIGCALGLAVKNQAKLTMFSQLVFLPSIMLSGIMFPADFLPEILNTIGKIFPASWGYKLMVSDGFTVLNLLPLLVILIIAIILCCMLLKKRQSE